jgi:hypothetical protein
MKFSPLQALALLRFERVVSERSTQTPKAPVTPISPASFIQLPSQKDDKADIFLFEDRNHCKSNKHGLQKLWRLFTSGSKGTK